MDLTMLLISSRSENVLFRSFSIASRNWSPKPIKILFVLILASEGIKKRVLVGRLKQSLDALNRYFAVWFFFEFSGFHQLVNGSDRRA